MVMFLPTPFKHCFLKLKRNGHTVKFSVSILVVLHTRHTESGLCVRTKELRKPCWEG